MASELNSLKYLIRGYAVTVGYRYWYANSPSLPFNEYPSTDPFYPTITPINPYSDVVIYDVPHSSGAASDVNAVFSLSNTPAIGDLVYIDGYGFAEPALGQYLDGHTLLDAYTTQSNVVGVAVKSNYFRPLGLVLLVNTETNVSPGQKLYLSATIAGKATPNPPISSGEVTVCVGIALTASSGGICAASIDIGEQTFVS